MRTILAIAIAAAAAGACSNPSTPAGYEGYVYHIPLVFGKAEFRNSLRGPASTGLSWRLYIKNVDMRAKSYKEEFHLLTRDNLSVEFEVNTRISLRPGSVKEIVEEWGEDQWYEWNVKEPLRTIVRSTVTQVNAVSIQVETELVRSKIDEELLAKYEGTPIKIESVDIGNIRFPPKVMAAIERKIGQQQELERQQFVLFKTQKEAAIRVLTALKEAKQQRIISETLDPLYVQRLAVDVYGHISKSSNKTIFVLPNSDKGTGLPLVLNSSRRKVLGPSDEKMLEEMEKRYMEIARSAGQDVVPADEPGRPTAPAPAPAPEPEVEPAPTPEPTPAAAPAAPTQP